MEQAQSVMPDFLPNFTSSICKQAFGLLLKPMPGLMKTGIRSKSQTLTENGSLIYDCRRQDMHSASRAVTHAARYAKHQSPHDAVISLAYAFIAFDIFPVGSYVNYID